MGLSSGTVQVRSTTSRSRLCYIAPPPQSIGYILFHTNPQPAARENGHGFPPFLCAHRPESAMMKSLILSVFVYGSAVSTWNFASLSTRQTAIRTVNTTSGLVSGHASSNASAGVSEYLGIPYAEPPVGDLRFAPPVQYSGGSGINGTSFVGTRWPRYVSAVELWQESLPA